MSRLCWQASLRRTLEALRAGEPTPPRVAILGIGSDLHGDDAAGVRVARQAAPLLASAPHVLVLDAGTAPENQTGPVRRFAPALVLLVDAADFGDVPGAVRWLHWAETEGLSASTHTLPPYVLARFLQMTMGCEVALVGIQPARVALDAGTLPGAEISAPVSAPVEAAISAVVSGLAEALLPPLPGQD